MIQSNNEKLPELFAALAAAQGQFMPIAKNRSVTITPKKDRETGYQPAPYHFKYADLEAIIAATRPALAANGLALLQPVMDKDGQSKMLTILSHASGAALIAETAIPKVGDRDPKQYGAMLTYLRRYMATSMLGVAADDDLDENGNHGDIEPGAATDKRESTSAPRVGKKAADAPATQAAPKTEGEHPMVGIGEIKFLETKAKAVGADLQEILQTMGGLIAEPGKLSKADFDRVRAELVSRG